jgi:hypothetical protein
MMLDWAQGNLFLISSETSMFLCISGHRSLYRVSAECYENVLFRWSAIK